MVKILINVVNARNIGGGFQVVYNFIVKTIEYQRDDVEWYYAVSEKLDSVLPDSFHVLTQDRYRVFPNQPDFFKTYRQVKRQLRAWENEMKPDVVFSPLSPGYFFFKTKEVMRFANAWSTNATPESWETLPTKQKIRTKIYNIMQRSLLRRAKYIVTQTEVVRGGLLRVTHLPQDHVVVVPNVLPAFFLSVSPEQYPAEDGWVDIAAVGGQMPHKNLDIIPRVLRILRDQYHKDNVRFHTTLPVDSYVWRKIEEEVESLGQHGKVINHGALSLTRLADLYKHCQYCFLPSVLETFSASTLEAMYFGLFTVASDMSFNREVLKDASVYFQPMNPTSAAEQFATLIDDAEKQLHLKEMMTERISHYLDFRKYFNDTVDFLIKVANWDE